MTAKKTATPEFSDVLIDAMHHEVAEDLFTLESSSLLAVRFTGRVRVHPARIIAGSGQIVFTPPKKLADADGYDVSGGVFGGYEGTGRILVAADGKDIYVYRMRKDEHFGVAAHAILAVDAKADLSAFTVTLPGPEAKVWQAVVVSGPTYIAFASRGPMRPLAVKLDAPVFVKPGFVVGWTIGMQVEAKGKGIADSRLSFTGQGTVFVQGSADEIGV
jgi:hypothetical protein